MGSPGDEFGRSTWETRHKVDLSYPLLIAAEEVTQGQYFALTGELPSRFDDAGAQAPVEMVSWLDAVEFCNLLSDRESLVGAYWFDGSSAHLLAVALEKRGYLVSAKSALTRLERRYPQATIRVDGGEMNAAAYARARLAEPNFQALVTRGVKIDLPLEPLWMLDEGDSSYVRVLQAEGIAPPEAAGIILLGTNGVLKAVEARTQRTMWQRPMNGLVTKPAWGEAACISFLVCSRTWAL